MNGTCSTYKINYKLAVDNDNIKMDFQEIICVEVDWIYLV